MIDWLEEHLPEQEVVRLIHGDFRLDNAVFRDSLDIMGVIDWELATLGSPIGDLSYFTLGWKMPLSGKGGAGLTDSDLKALGIPEVDEIYGRSFDRSALVPPASFAFYDAYNAFRLACILHGIGARAARGNASNARAGTIARAVPVAAAIARRFTGGAGNP